LRTGRAGQTDIALRALRAALALRTLRTCSAALALRTALTVVALRPLRTGHTLIALVALRALLTGRTDWTLRTDRTLRTLLAAGRARQHTVFKRQGGRDDDALSRPACWRGAPNQRAFVYFDNDVVVVVRKDSFLQRLIIFINVQAIDQPDEWIKRIDRRRLRCRILHHEAAHLCL
jgi:hypothetical protein